MLSIFYGRRVLRQAKIVPDEKKKLTFKHFRIFSSDILKSLEGFFTESVGFLLKYRQNFLIINLISRQQPASRFLFFIFFLRRRGKNLCRDPSTIECTENGFMAQNQNYTLFLIHNLCLKFPQN